MAAGYVTDAIKKYRYQTFMDGIRTAFLLCQGIDVLHVVSRPARQA
jgi:hypothetical protein